MQIIQGVADVTHILNYHLCDTSEHRQVVMVAPLSFFFLFLFFSFSFFFFFLFQIQSVTIMSQTDLR